MSSFDGASMGRAFAAPGMDPRQWISYGTVDEDTDDAPSVNFDEELGPMINVTLQPSGAPVVCRVAASIAGDGEAEYYPFIAGDEVVVAIPAGDEKSGCVILGRHNNALDVWPQQVAGQDATENKFGFRRMRAPFILETASSYLIRSAVTQAFMSLNAKGEWTMANSAAFMSVASDFVTMQSIDNDLLVQINLRDRIVALEAGGSLFHLKADGDSQLFTPGRLMIGTAGNVPTVFHGVTAESVVVLLQAVLQTIAVLQPGVLTGAALGGAAIAIMNAAIAQGAVLPATLYTAAMTAALSVPPDPLGVNPGYGVAGLLIG